LSELSNKILKTNIGYIERNDNEFADNILKSSQKAPNTNAMNIFNINKINVSELINKIKNNQIKTILAVEEDFLFAPELANVFAKLNYLLLCSSNHNKANIFADSILPTATFAEYEGTFTNCDNIVQHFRPAIIASDNINPADAIRMGINRSRLDVFGAKNDK
jgi:predicted molibdopterin-dependent oxidoreductase YjgC